MNKRNQLTILLVGALVGSLATLLLTPSSQTERFSEVLKPDMPEISDISVAEAEFLRAGRYENISTIEETLALPTDFAETEALYTIAGRSDSGGVQDLIYQAARIQDRTDRLAALNILFLRLTELDPKSALAISRSPTFRVETRFENDVWVAWGRLDLRAALDEAENGTSSQKSSAAQSLYASVRGLENEGSELIYDALHIRPGRGAKLQHLYALADLSPADAIRYVETLATAAEQREQFGWLARYLARSATLEVNYSVLIHSAANRRYFEQTYGSQAAAADPEAALKKALAAPQSADSQRQILTALQELATQDPVRAVEYLEQTLVSPDSRRPREMIVATIAASDPDLALTWAREHDSSTDQSMLVGVLKQIAASDPQFALSEAQSLKNLQSRDRVISAVTMNLAGSDPEQAIQVLEQISNEQMKSASASQIAAAWAQTDFDGALNWVSSLDDSTRRQTLRTIGQHLVRSDVDKAIDLLAQFPGDETRGLNVQVAQQLAQTRGTDAALAFVNRYKGDAEYSHLLTGIISMTASTDPVRAMRMAEDIEDEQSRDKVFSNIVSRHAATNPQQALQWMNSISSPEGRSRAMSQVAMFWFSTDPSAASAWVDGLPRGGDRDDAILASITANRGSSTDTQALIESIDDPSKRKQATIMRIQSLVFKDRVAAEQLLETTDLTKEERDQLKKMFDMVTYDFIGDY